MKKKIPSIKKGIMKNKVRSRKKKFMFFMSLIVITGLWYSCGDDDTIVTPVPTVDSISLTSGSVGTAFIIKGTNFGTSTSDITVSFNGTLAKVNAVTNNSLVTSVPVDATTGSISITKGEITISGPTFTVISAPTLPEGPEDPTIVSYDPTSGAVGTTVTITGTNFSTERNGNFVVFNGSSGTVINSATATSIVTTVPVKANTGPVTLTIDVNTTITGPEFTVTRPVLTIDSFNPTVGVEGTEVTIIGANFNLDPAKNNVKFNGIDATVVSATETQINTIVPVGATTGIVSVVVLDQTAEGPTFTVEGIFTATPNTGIVGTQVVLTGEGFSTIPTENILAFNGIPAVVNSATTTTITTTVPTGATSGPITLSINGLNFQPSESVFAVPTGGGTTPQNFKVAFIADTTIDADADAVLNLIKNEGAQAVIHPGDLDYADNPQAFEDNINAVLGENFPYFVSAGNHDNDIWNGAGGYSSFFEARMNRLGIPWSGDYGVLSSFTYQGIFFVATAPTEFGTTPEMAGNYIKDELSANNATWSISFWHKNQRLMQLGGKPDEAGWDVYEESRKGGAIMATGHEHSYSRTHEMSNFETQTVSTTSNTVNLVTDNTATTGTDEGRSFAFVSGLGGNNVRSANPGLADSPWWANVYHSGNGGQFGALFAEFNYNGDATLARFYFKNIDGEVRDVFFVRSNN